MNPECYTYFIRWSQEDRLFLGRVCEFDSLTAHGDTPARALREIIFVVKNVVEDLKANNETIPEPMSEVNWS